MKLYDFECATCGSSFEETVGDDTHELPCKKPACTGYARRLLGGMPAFHKASRYRSPHPYEVLGQDDGKDIVRVPMTDVLALAPDGTALLHQHEHKENGECVSRMGIGKLMPPPKGRA